MIGSGQQAAGCNVTRYSTYDQEQHSASGFISFCLLEMSGKMEQQGPGPRIPGIKESSASFGSEGIRCTENGIGYLLLFKYPMKS